MENGLRTRMELSPYNGVRGSERVHLPSDAHDLRLPPHHPGRVAPFNVALHALRPLSSRAPAMCAGRISTDILGRHVARLEGFSAKSFAEISDSRSCSEQSVCWCAGARSEQASPENHSMFPCARRSSPWSPERGCHTAPKHMRSERCMLKSVLGRWPAGDNAQLEAIR